MQIDHNDNDNADGDMSLYNSDDDSQREAEGTPAKGSRDPL